MIKRSTLAITISALCASAQAVPFLPMDARGLAMGNTGVASAQRAHAPAYNPSLLSQAEHDDDFALLIRAGGAVSSEDDLYDTFVDINDDLYPELEGLLDDQSANNFTDNVEALNDAADRLSNAISALDNLNSGNRQTLTNELEAAKADFDSNVSAVQSSVADVGSVANQMGKALNKASGDALSGRAGGALVLAFPGKQIAAAVGVDTNVTFSGRAFYTSEDDTLLNAYAPAANALLDQASTSTQGIDALINTLNGGGDLSESQLRDIENSINEFQNFDSDEINTAASDPIRIIENGEVTNAASDPELNSYIEVAALGTVDYGLSLSREFTFGDNRKVAIGLTPKLQKVAVFHYLAEADSDEEIDADQVQDDAEYFQHLNADLGISFRLGSTNKWVVGVVGKNLFSKEFETDAIEVDGSHIGRIAPGITMKMEPQWRAGAAFNGDWTSFAVDVDLVENDPIAFEAPSQYAAIGAELDVWRTLQLRLGYRTNMSVSDAEIASVGLGLSVLGVHLDLAALANPNNPENDLGVAFETGFYF